MNVDKKVKSEVLKVYDTWLHSYLHGDVEIYDSFLDNEYHFIGSAKNEEFLNRKDTTQFFAATGDQFAGKTEIRDETKTIEQFGELIFITHIFDGWFLNENDWTYYARFRFTSVLKNTQDGWRFIYQHFSIPDSKTEEGETIGYDKINDENQELREAITRRTFELEAKNRELEIEGALDRIRAQAVAMRTSSDLLDIVVTMRTEFIKLGHEAHYFWHMMWLPETYEKAMTSGDGTKIGFVMQLPRHIHGDIPLLAKWEKSDAPIVVYPMDTEAAIDYVDKMVALGDFQNIDPQAPSEDDIRHIGGLTFIMARTTHGEIGYSLPGVVENPPKGDLEILEKFAGAFDLAHRRFLDLQKAEKQAREVQIELALEKVRSRTMAMQKSEELKEVIQTVYEQFIHLNINIEHTGFILDYNKNDVMHIWLADKNAIQNEIKLPYFDSQHWNSFREAKKKEKNFFANHLPFKEKNKFYKEVFKHIPNIPEDVKQFYFDCPALTISTVLMDNVGLYIENFDSTPYSEDENAILMRFGNVFQQTYTRFLDLQKAEEQARRAQIEMALEKVRSRTMAMQHSDELPEAANVLFTEVQKLGIAAWSCGYNILSEDKKSSTCIMSSEGEIQSPFILPLTEHKSLKPWHKAILNNEDFFVYEQGGKDLEAHYEYMLGLPELQETFLQFKDADIPLPTFQVNHLAKFTNGFLLFITYERVPEAHDIFKRFASVFEQTYTRFLDLQKAEAQAREAQIEAALERTRTQSMLMQHSSELDATSKIFHEQLQSLGIATEFSYVWLPDEAKNEHKFWVAWNVEKKGDAIIKSKAIVYPMDKTEPYTANCFKDWASGEPVHIHQIKPKEVATFFSAWEELLKDAKKLNPTYFSEGLFYAEAFMKYGCFGINIKRSITEEEKQILQRFSIEFERTYTRFLDLKKAEAQAREAQIEASLERVRSKTMAMHSSQDVGNTMVLLFEELETLGIKANRNGIIIIDEDAHGEIWTAKYTSTNEIELIAWNLDMSLHGLTKQVYKSWKNKESGTVYPLIGEDQNAYYKALNKSTDIPVKFNLDTLPEREWGYTFNFSEGFIYLFTEEKMLQAHEHIPERFASVFGQTYRRYQDLKKAEEQAREAQIEASLEKVRSVALSLQKSEDMLAIAQALYEQLLALGFKDIRNAIIDIHNDETETFLDYDYSHDMSSAITEFSYYGDPVIEQQIKKTQSGHDAFFEIELKGKQLDELIETRIRNGEKDDPRLHEIDHLTYNLYSFGNGAIGISNFGILSEEQKKVLKRFRNVFTFAYKRYTDLANAEAQAREAKIEAALEKVRSVALSMNESTDLLHIAKALYEQLVELGFSDIRNALIDVNNEDEETFLDYDYSDEMGGTVTLMSYDDDPTLEEQVRVIAATTDGFSEMVLEGQQLEDLIEMRRNNGEAEDPRLLKTDSVSYNLYAFGNGAVGISNFGVLSKDQKSILDRFRNVFTFAYQRFKDLQVREEQSAKLLDEKLRLEKTLSDLQATQKQLIQSEKMASLGELTAGIAHEIQNPLNFVNNFSEVSNELIDEIDEEIAKGDMEEVKALLNDVKQNLEKINHHGKRADAIVKGMLQHSRKSTAEKEPTDINKLAEEYLRLAYHGLRAKDKSFNATLETDFDASIGKVNVIPQDMGRVILNLITNAFYATNEQKKTLEDPAYKPTVLISTKKENTQLLISVKDNGNGIPKHVVDKIFQPFFTTKPTGQGTGLGLSMSYDIITKGHGGELTVETKESEGTIFTIKIPII